MDQADSMDFKSLKAKFQDEELLLKKPRVKPALPEKPKVVPPPQSPTHYVPAGARPSLLTSINQTLERKTAIAPRVVFKDEKESKKPLIQSNSKSKNKSEGKLKGSKDKATKGSKEKLDDDSSEQKQKKENSKDKKASAQKEGTAELVPATPPPKAATPKKKGFLGFRKSVKRESMEVPPEPILDTTSSDVLGPAPLIPVPSDSVSAPPEPEISAPNALLPNNPTLPDPTAPEEIPTPSTVPESPDFSPPPVVSPELPAPEPPAPESEPPIQIDNPVLPVSRPVSQIEILPSPPSAAPTPPPCLPEPEVAAEAGIEALNTAVTAATDLAATPPSPKMERPISALSALERAEDMSAGKRTPPGDQRILNALEKARRKSSSPLTNPSRSCSITPPPEELLPPSPTSALPELPPIDYEDRAGNALPLKAAQVNGIVHREASPVLEGITEEGLDTIPELLLVPPPPPRKVLPDVESLGPAPEEPDRPLSVNLSEFIPPPPPPPMEHDAPLEFSETDIPEFDDVTSDAHSPDLPVSEWASVEYTGPDVTDLAQVYRNGITTPGAEVHTEPTMGDEYQDNPLPESPYTISTSVTESRAERVNSLYESTENVYEDVSVSGGKKKGKTDGGKKRKGPPKNPYVETAPETNQEKTKTGRFGRDKKAAAEGPDEKELKKREKQRLEKEKKELKEKQEREKKEQKEREKKENELKKKFKITGQEDTMYQAKVTVTTKGRKNDLPVKTGEIISIIRTTNCPKGKWLARDSSNNYGYVAVDHVELDIKEMLELGKKTIRKTSTNVLETDITEADITSTGSRTSNHYPLSAESFSDDSEEWTGDEEETLSPAPEAVDPLAPVGHTRTLSMPVMGNNDLSINHQHSHSDINTEGSQVQARNEALQKLTTFFYSPKPVEPTASNAEPDTSPVLVTEEAVYVPQDSLSQEIDFDHPDTLILPPPELYADITVE